jgi:hypothetical protein
VRLVEAGMRSGQALTCAQPCPEHMKAFALLLRIGWLRGRIAPGLVQALGLTGRPKPQAKRC